MKNSTFLLSVVFISATLLSCSQGFDSKTEWTVYNQAMERSDLITAAQSATRIIALGEHESAAYDSLAQIYLKVGMDVSAAATAKQGLADHESELLVEVAAKSLKNLNKTEESLAQFIRLLEMRPTDIWVTYEIAFAHINLQQYENAMNYINLVIDNENSATTTMVEFVNDQARQKVPYKAVALNLRGFIFMQSGQYQQAAEAYQQALQIFPEYQLASNNLRYLIAQAGGEKAD